jgi:hypothetical protein
MSEDTIYTEKNDEPFRFNDAVARVFPDMLRRSIPGYAASLEAIGSLAARYGLLRPRMLARSRIDFDAPGNQGARLPHRRGR